MLTDESGRYAGILRVLTARGAPPDTRAGSLAICQDRILIPEMNVQDALHLFDGSGTPALAVLADKASGRVIGVLDEADALHAYAQALEDQRRTLAGEDPGR